MDIKRLGKLLFLVFAVTACQPDDDYFVEVDYNKLPYLIADNYNLSTFNAALQVTGYDQVLAQEGPYTVLVPSNSAFLFHGLGSDNIKTMRSAELAELVNYHILEGRYVLDSLPFLFNQEINTRLGVPIYVTRWLNGPDTVVTINGGTVYLRNIQASNGYAQVLNTMLKPNVQENVVDIINNHDNLTLFAEAVRRSGLAETLRNKGTCTVFVPDNEAMNDYGFSTVQQINDTDPGELSKLVAYHVMETRRFVNDFALTILPSQTGTYPLDFYDATRDEVETANSRDATRGFLNARMLDGNRVQMIYSSGMITIGQQMVDAYRFTLVDEGGGETLVSPRVHDLISRNGCVHIIDKVLGQLR